MTRPRIEPRPTRPLANTLTIILMSGIHDLIFIYCYDINEPRVNFTSHDFFFYLYC